MTGRIITVTSGKGGVGKTTTSANLGLALAMQGLRVICIDADIGLRNLDIMLGLENRIVYDIINYAEGRCRLRQALVQDKRFPELYLLPAAQTRDKSALTADDMQRAAQEAAEMADFVLIDSPAGIEEGFRFAVAPADQVLIVTNPEITAVRDADRVIGLIEADHRDQAYLVVNRLRADQVRRSEMLDPGTVVELLSIPLIGIVPEDPDILAASNRGNPVVLKSRSAAGKAYRNIAQRLVTGADVPYVPLKRPNLFQRIFGSS